MHVLLSPCLSRGWVEGGVGREMGGGVRTTDHVVQGQRVIPSILRTADSADTNCNYSFFVKEMRKFAKDKRVSFYRKGQECRVVLWDNFFLVQMVDIFASEKVRQ